MSTDSILSTYSDSDTWSEEDIPLWEDSDRRRQSVVDVNKCESDIFQCCEMVEQLNIDLNRIQLQQQSQAKRINNLHLQFKTARMRMDKLLRKTTVRWTHV